MRLCVLYLQGFYHPADRRQIRAASVVATEAPTISPATAAPAAQAPAAPPVQNVPSYNVSSNTTVVSYMYVANVKYSIYLRSLPEENDSNIITEIPLGTQVGFIENADSVFAKINYNGRIGYSKREYLSSVSPNAGYSGGRAWSDTMTVTNVKYAIYLRSTPSEASDANIIMEIPVGSKVTYLDTQTIRSIKYLMEARLDIQNRYILPLIDYEKIFDRLSYSARYYSRRIDNSFWSCSERNDYQTDF